MNSLCKNCKYFVQHESVRQDGSLVCGCMNKDVFNNHMDMWTYYSYPKSIRDMFPKREYIDYFNSNVPCPYFDDLVEVKEEPVFLEPNEPVQEKLEF